MTSKIVRSGGNDEILNRAGIYPKADFSDRGQKVMLDRHLAELYGVPTGILNRAVKRNKSWFPADFMFQLAGQEWENLKCQIGISSWGGDRRDIPHVFTEHGVAMLSSVLRSRKAVAVNIAVVRTFVRLREMVSAHKELAVKLAELERRIDTHDEAIQDVLEAIRRLTTPEEGTRRQIGFRP